MKKTLRTLLSLLLAVTLLTGVTLPALAGETVPSVTLDGENLALTDGTGTLTATVSGVADPSTPLTYVWTSSAPGVITVTGNDNTGALAAVAPGTADITVAVQSAEGTVLCSAVRSVLSPGITMRKTLSLRTHATASLMAQVYLPSGKSNSVIWTSENEYYAAVAGNGTVSNHATTATVTAMSEGSVAITAAAGGYSATCTVEIRQAEAEEISADASAQSPLSFSSLTSNLRDACDDVLDSSLFYVTGLSVPTDEGTLYYGYVSENEPGAGVGSSEKYYDDEGSGRRLLSGVAFVPKGSFSGTAEIRYTGYDSRQNFFSGIIRVSVDSDSTISYTTRGQESVNFLAQDFAAACLADTGQALQSVVFSSLPSSSKGALYYSYSGSSLDNKVEAGTAYYRTKTPALSNVSFVAAQDYTGTVKIPYRGYDTVGNSFYGTVSVTVTAAQGSDALAEQITYRTKQDKPVAFDEDDFNSLVREKTGKNLSYVRFSLPDSSSGTLYYNYTSSSRYGGKASSSTRYYRSSYPYLDKVSFVPASGWTGTADIPFSGENTAGEGFSGVVSVTVSGTDRIGAIYYSVAEGGSVSFQTDSFRSVCENAGGGTFLSAVFTPPASSVGKLVCRQGSSADTVTSSQSYSTSGSRRISDLSFLPAAGFTGTVSIPYTGKGSSRSTYYGSVVITVTASSASSFWDMGGYAWANAAVEYLRANGVTNGTAPGYYSPGLQVSRGSFVVMLCRAFQFSGGSGASGFSDVPAGSYYESALRTAKALGIALGSDDGRFYPDRAMTREEAAAFLQRALRAYGWTVADGKRSDLAAYHDAASVSEYAVGAVSAMTKLGILRGNDTGFLMPQGTLTRAEMAVMIYRAIML